MIDIHVIGLARSGTSLARDMLRKLLEANGIRHLNMGEFFSLLRTYEYDTPVPRLLSDDKISLPEQAARHAEMLERYESKLSLYARYTDQTRLVKHIYGYRYDMVLDNLPSSTKFLCVSREDLLDHVLSLIVAAKVGIYNISLPSELAQLPHDIQPFNADLDAVKEWSKQHKEWQVVQDRLQESGRVVAAVRYEHMANDMCAAMQPIMQLFGVNELIWPWTDENPQDARNGDGKHVLKLWSKAEKLAFVINHGDVSDIIHSLGS